MSTMTTATTKSLRLLPAMLPSIVMAVAFGILGMHALNTHGLTTETMQHSGSSQTTTAPLKGTATMPMAASAMPSGSHDLAVGNSGHPTSVTTDSVTFAHAVAMPHGAGGHDMGAMMILCLAMLVAAGFLALISVALWRSHRPAAHRVSAPTVPNRFAFPRLATGPPRVWEFSVIRC